MTSLNVVRHALLGLALWVAAQAAIAGSISVTPTRIALSARQPVTAMTVTNNAAEAVLVEVELNEWLQVDGRDDLHGTDALIASPPIFRVAPGGKQVVRVGLRRAADPARELAFRMFVKEVPVEKTDSNNLAVALRLSVPVLVAPVASAAPNLVWQVQRADDGGLTVGVHNTGNMHAKVRDFGLLDSGDQPLTQRRQVMSYVLAGESQQWRVDGAVALAAGTPVVLDSQGDGKSRRHPLTVQ